MTALTDPGGRGGLKMRPSHPTNSLMGWVKCLRLGAIAGAVLIATVAMPSVAKAQHTVTETAAQLDDAGARRALVSRTDGPRQTLASLLSLRAELEHSLAEYLQTQSHESYLRLDVSFDQAIALIDLDEVPIASRDKVGFETLGAILDIFGRVGPPRLENVPDGDAARALGEPSYGIPGTPLRIVRVEQGEHAGEYLFGANTVAVAPRFLRQIERLPLRSELPIKSWQGVFRDLTGPMIPIGLALAVPDRLRGLVLDTPIWKVLIAGAVLVAGGSGVALLIWFNASPGPRLEWTPVLRALVPPIALVVVTAMVGYFFRYELNILGRFARVWDVVETIIVYMAVTWAFWLTTVALLDWVISRSTPSKQSFDASMLRLIGRMFAVVGGLTILSVGASEIGLPVLSILAGLGIGGLAIALAIRPTLENLIGGFILYLDRPVKVGDFCTFGDQAGTIESIGIRSTQIRALDRTVISIPNSQFADMQLINWARCDQMLIERAIRLRYETDTEQLRYVLVKIREMLHAHPRIDSGTVRVRFSGHGEFSLDISIRVYAMTQEWNDYFAIQEDVLLRIDEIVRATGAGFAFPSQTLYFGRDTLPDDASAAAARREVAGWRQSRRLPFPDFAPSTLERLASTLPYPPQGSAVAWAAESDEPAAGDERLSAAPTQNHDVDSRPTDAVEQPKKV